MNTGSQNAFQYSSDYAIGNKRQSRNKEAARRVFIHSPAARICRGCDREFLSIAPARDGNNTEKRSYAYEHAREHRRPVRRPVDDTHTYRARCEVHGVGEQQYLPQWDVHVRVQRRLTGRLGQGGSTRQFRQVLHHTITPSHTQTNVKRARTTSFQRSSGGGTCLRRT